MLILSSMKRLKWMSYNVIAGEKGIKKTLKRTNHLEKRVEKNEAEGHMIATNHR